MLKRIIVLLLLLSLNFSSCSTYKPVTIREHILYDYFKVFRKEEQKQLNKEPNRYTIKLKNYYVKVFFGSYYDAYVVNIGLNPEYKRTIQIEIDYTIGYQTITFNNPSYIPVVWKDHAFYCLSKSNESDSPLDGAYEKGIIADDNILEIKKYYDYYCENQKNLNDSDLDKEYGR